MDSQVIPKTFFMRQLITNLLTLCFAASVAHALDLTPRRGVRQGNEGPPIPVIKFSDGQDHIEYQPPAGWQAGGGGHSVTFFTPDPMSWMRLVAVDRGRASQREATPPAKEDLQAWAAQFVPSGAQRVEFVRMIPSPFTVGTHATTEFIFTCVWNGFRVSLSVTVIDFSSKERLVMLVAAEPGNFAQVRQQAVASMYSWSRE